MSMDLSGIVSATIPMAESAPSANPSGAKEMIAEQTTEAPTAETPKEKPDLDYANRFNMLARRERALQQREKEIKEQAAKYENLSTLKDRARKDPVNALKELDLSYDDLTNTILNDNKPTTEMSLAELKKEIESLREERNKEKQELETKKQQEATEGYKNFLRDHVKDKEEYEFLAANGDEAIDLVCRTIVEYHQKYDKLLSEDEACKLVEEHLESESEKFFKLKKVQAKFGLTQTPSSEHAQAEQADQKATGQPKTLTNQMSPQTKSQSSLIKDDSQSLKEAAALMRWQR